MAKAEVKLDAPDTSPPARDWSETLFLPATDFPMKAGLPQKEPELIAHWERLKLYQKLRKSAKGRPPFVLHDGPPYANGHLHIGHALNKILKDTIVRAQQMMGRDANYVPGWDCHGLPIEWKIEEQYRAKGKNKDAVAINEFRKECRDFAAHWMGVQSGEFQRLGVVGDFGRPYSTMDFASEARIAEELLKFALNGALYQGSKPVMWSVVERTALAEAEVEYHDHQSPTIWVKFPVAHAPKAAKAKLDGAAVVIWTTTPWTIPGNRAIGYGKEIAYGLYEITDAPDDNWTKRGEKLIIADKLAEPLREAGRITAWKRLGAVKPEGLVCRHPFADAGYDFPVRLYAGDFVTDDAGTGFVHIAPGHGADDYQLYVANKAKFAKDGISEVPHTVGADGHYFAAVPLFGGEAPKRVIDDKGKFADANEAVIVELLARGRLAARGRLKHTYPHSWRSKAPVIFRNTPQWFIALDKKIRVKGSRTSRTIRGMALVAIADTAFYPDAGRNRLHAMVAGRPDWVISRQRAWGVPIAVFQNKDTGEVLPAKGWAGAKAYQKRVREAFLAEGADAWFADGAAQRFLGGLVEDVSQWSQVRDILDVWFDSGSTHAFVLEDRRDLTWPAALYLEGSDQHRGWFMSSLMESVGTRGRAPYDAVLTHGFILDEKGDEKMSKSKGNVLSPQDVANQNGAEILRLWVASSDYTQDIRFGPGIVQSAVEGYRKLRNTLRFMIGNLGHYSDDLRVAVADMPPLERYMLHRLAECDAQVREGYGQFDFRRVFQLLSNFCINDLSAFYFDIRKDALYCEPHSSIKRRAALTVLDELFSCLTAWLAPIMCFTMEEAWLCRFPGKTSSVHLRQFPDIPANWRDDALAERWRKVRQVRKVLTGALEIERRDKRIGSSLEAAPRVFVPNEDLRKSLKGLDLAEIAITSGIEITAAPVPDGAFTLPDVPGVGVVPALAKGQKCARSWRVVADVGQDKAFPDLSARDAAAVREWEARKHG